MTVPNLEPSYLSICNLSHAFAADKTGQVTALTDINIDVARGQLVSLVGQSGCGKSTLLNVIAGLITPSSGQIQFHGAPDRPKPTIGYITQEDRLLPWRTVLRNATLPLELRRVPLQQAADAAQALLTRVGLGQFLGKKPHQLSGGMRQRAAIARMLTLRPDILLMDEPFGALDAWTRHSLHELLVDIRTEFETTIILVTHDVHEALALSDKIITLAPHPGRVLSEYTLPASTLPRPVAAIYGGGELFAQFTAIRADLGLKD